MAKSIPDIPKRGRPKTTGRGRGVMVRLHADAISAVDQWSTRQDDQPSRPEAIRRLVEAGLAVARGVKPLGKRATAESDAIASNEIDRVQSGHAGTPDEQASRKRRLLKGPKEFRDMRAPKAKS
jgi:hypothetical protein